MTQLFSGLTILCDCGSKVVLNKSGESGKSIKIGKDISINSDINCVVTIKCKNCGFTWSLNTWC